MAKIKHSLLLVIYSENISKGIYSSENLINCPQHTSGILCDFVLGTENRKNCVTEIRTMMTDSRWDSRFLFFFQSHRSKTYCHGSRLGSGFSVSSVSWVADYLSATAPLGAPCVLWWLWGNPPGNFQLAIMFTHSDFISHSTCRRTPMTMLRLWGNRDGRESGHRELVKNFVEWMKKYPLLNVTKTRKMVAFLDDLMISDNEV